MVRRRRRTLAAALLAGAAIVLVAATAPVSSAGQHGWRHGHREDHYAARRLVRSGEILPLGRVLRSARRHQPGRVLEAEFESEDGRHVYEVIILDPEGKVWELKMDATDGRLLEREH